MLLAVIWAYRFPRVELKNYFFNVNVPNEKSWLFETNREVTNECRKMKHGK